MGSMWASFTGARLITTHREVSFSGSFKVQEIMEGLTKSNALSPGP